MNVTVFNKNTGFDEEKTLSKSDVGLGNVTNDAQIPKSIVTTKGDIITATGNATPVRQGIGNNGQIIIADSNLTNGIGYKDPSFRNWVINGNMEVAQRGTSWTNPASFAYTLDKWKLQYDFYGGTPPNIIHSQQQLTPGELDKSKYFYRVNVDGSGSSFGDATYYPLLTCIEHGLQKLAGVNKKVTLSFMARSSIANKKIGTLLYNSYGTGGSPSANEAINGNNWTLTSNWTLYSHTFTLADLSGKTFGTNNDDYIGLQFYLAWGSVRAYRVNAETAETFVGAGNIDIAQVALYAGDVAYPFEPVPFDIELQRCMRYYEKSYAYETYAGASAWVSSLGFSGAGGNCSIGNYIIYWGHYRVPKRISATPIIYDQSGNVGKVGLTRYGGNADLNSTASVAHFTQKGFCIAAQATSVAQRGMYFHYVCDADF